MSGRPPPSRVVFDCNIFLQAMISGRGPAHGCYELAAAGRVILFISPVVLAEVRELSAHRDLRRFKSLTPERIERFLEDVTARAVLVRDVPIRFTYERDPDDAHYVNLALAAEASLIVSRDKDLLDLMDVDRPEAADFQRRFPGLRILEPTGLLWAVGASDA